MPGLNRELVEHRLPIKSGFRPFKYQARRFNPKMYDQITLREKLAKRAPPHTVGAANI